MEELLLLPPQPKSPQPLALWLEEEPPLHPDALPQEELLLPVPDHASEETEAVDPDQPDQEEDEEDEDVAEGVNKYDR